jgi:hypothetical protein
VAQGLFALKFAGRGADSFFLEQPVAEAFIDGDPDTSRASVIVPNSTGC